MFHLDEQTKPFLRDRVYKMLASKARLDKSYQERNDIENTLYNKLFNTLTDEQKDLLEEYRNAAIDRETQGLYFAFIAGVKDGVTLKELAEAFD